MHITVYGEKYHTEHAGALGGPLDVNVHAKLSGGAGGEKVGGVGGKVSRLVLWAHLRFEREEILDFAE